MRKAFIAATIAAAALFGAASSAMAAIIDNSIVIPDSEILVNFNNTGLDWVYVGPVAPGEFGPGEVEEASYRAAEGWRAATAAEWALRPDWDDFIRPGFMVDPNAGHSDHTSYRFASEYWSSFSHVDLNDYFDGRVTDGVNGVTSGVPETIYVRNSANVAVVPEPATWAMMLAGFFAVGGALRTTTRRYRLTVA